MKINMLKKINNSNINNNIFYNNEKAIDTKFSPSNKE